MITVRENFPRTAALSLFTAFLNLLFSLMGLLTHTQDKHTYTQSTAIIEDDLEYNESKATVADKTKDLGFDLPQRLKSRLEKSSQNLKKRKKPL